MSLRLRLTLLNSLILLLVAGTLVTAVYAILARGLERQIDESLREEARLYGSDVSVWFYREARRPAGTGPGIGAGALPPPMPSPATATGPVGRVLAPGAAIPPSAAVQAGVGGQPVPIGSPTPPDAFGPPSLVVPILRRFAGTNTFIQVTDIDGVIQARSDNLGQDTLPLPPDALQTANDGGEWLGEVSVDEQPLRQLVTPLFVSRAAGEAPTLLVLQVAHPLGSLNATLSRLQATALGVGAAGVLIALVAAWLLARTALLPIDRLAAVADAIGASRDFGQRVPVAARSRRDEIGRLATSFNNMLGELQASHEQMATALIAQRRFVADASHELRTPLATMRGNVDLLYQMTAEAESGDPEQLEILGDVSSEAARMSRLVADLLLLAQADAGQHLTLRSVDLTEVTRDAVRSARRLRDDVTVDTRELPDGLWVHGHADRLLQVLLILLDNALKHTPDGGHITVGAEQIARAGTDGIAVHVADTGPGVPLDEQARIFDRFYRGAGSRSGEGTGLGLAIARWLVEEHRGTIELASVPGEGATFTVWLPAIPTPPPIINTEPAIPVAAHA
jgi:two-component system OmpR family sensor kinase